jgi:glycosyltransferase involved in cell wall biosynthesis
MYLVRSWPRLTQTFVLNEILAQERLGTELQIYSLSRSGDRLVQPQVHDVRATVRFLDEPRGRRGTLADHALVARRAPRAHLSTALFAACRPQLAAGYATCSTQRCLAHAVRVAAALHRAERSGVPVGHLHAHFAHDPGLIALLTHRLTGVPYSITAHARDLYQVPAASMRARARAATALVTCCAANVEYLRSVLPAADLGRLRLIHHGIDLDRFTPTPTTRRGPLKIVSVGRLVEKKGFPDLLRACHALRHRLPGTPSAFRLRIYGDGPLRAELSALRDRLGLHDAVEFVGERDGPAVLRAYQRADIFALTPCVTTDGDRDGVPNVIVEAMACGLPVVATAAGGIGEIVRNGVNGRLAAPHDIGAVAGHLHELVTDAALRRRLGDAGRRTVADGFDVNAAARELRQVFTSEPAPSHDDRGPPRDGRGASCPSTRHGDARPHAPPAHQRVSDGGTGTPGAAILRMGARTAANAVFADRPNRLGEGA